MKLRDYQQEILKAVLSSTTNDIVQLDTGAGKTPIEAALCEVSELSLFIAHRNVLITQASEKLAAFKLTHDTISSEYTRRRCMSTHRQHGKNYITRGHKTRLVASIGSLISHHKRGRLAIDTSLPWLIIIDEAHHVVPNNQWGALRNIFPNARIVGFTATPARMDGESLSIRNKGLFDKLIQAEYLKTDGVIKLINQGSLSDFAVYSPNIEFSQGDRDFIYIAQSPVDTYQKYLTDRRTIVMCPSINNAEEVAEEFQKVQIPAACISSNMSQTDVAQILDLFAADQIKVLCNVDMVGEGFDVPGIEGLIMMRRTQSLIAYRQWIGRALRPAPGKKQAIIIDLVNNVAEHGLPDDNIEWNIDDPPKATNKIKSIPCKKCGLWYPIGKTRCPECGKRNPCLDRTVIGGHYLNIKRLDLALIEKTRREVSEAEYQKRLETEILPPSYDFFDGGSFGKLAHQIRMKFIDIIKDAGIPVKDINDIIKDKHRIDFWIANFKAPDATGLTTDKALKVFRKWQKSQK